MPEHARQDVHLAPELRRLSGETRRLWGDLSARREAIEAVVAGMDGRADLATAVARIDSAVVDGLQALGLPRGPIRGLAQIDAVMRPYGEKKPDCSLVVSGWHIRRLLADPLGPDSTFRTWIHASLHARRPYTERYRDDYREFRGYEEGMVEGLARELVREKARMDPREQSYDYYVTAYRALDGAAGIEPARLWRRLWATPAGEVRGAFVDAVDALREESTRLTLASEQRTRLQSAADRLFASERVSWVPDERVILRMWSLGLR